ncbi:MAG: signal peptidase I [Eubacterium sp.]
MIAIIVMRVPLIVPKTMGYQLYTVVSGSMEPAVPTGSLVYIKDVEPGDIETGDIIAFYGSDAQGIHHHIAWYLTVNAMGEFITRGDANAENDMNPVTYEQYVGKMVRSIPKVGGIVQTMSLSAQERRC